MSQAYYQLLVGRLSGSIGARRRRLAWQGDRYRHLARVNRLIVEARDRIERQKERIFELEHAQRSTAKARQLLRQFEMTLHLMTEHRAVILKKVRSRR